MLSIHLKDLVFQGFHGLYEAEKLTGNKFIVNLHAHFMPPVAIITQLEQTLNYEAVFAMVKKRMDEPTDLLETLAMEMAHAVLEVFKMVEAVYVSIEKCQPPIAGMNGSAVVSIQLSRN